MRRDTLGRGLVLVGRVGVGALLLVAALLKLKSPSEFATEIANYQLAPAVAPYLAASLPMVELVIGLALLMAPRAWRRAAAAIALVLFGMFEVAVSAAYLRHINIDCGCFGAGGGPITFLTILRNAALMAVSAALVRWQGPGARGARGARGAPDDAVRPLSGYDGDVSTQGLSPRRPPR